MHLRFHFDQSYNEIGWTNCDVDAIVKARESTKNRKDCEFIGEKGQGFYSVFRIATQAIVLSGQTHFYDTSSNQQGLVKNPDQQNAMLNKYLKKHYSSSYTLDYPVGGYFFKLSRQPCDECGFKYVWIIYKCIVCFNAHFVLIFTFCTARYVVPQWLSPESLPPSIARHADNQSVLCLRIGSIEQIDVRDTAGREIDTSAVMKDLRKTLLRVSSRGVRKPPSLLVVPSVSSFIL